MNGIYLGLGSNLGDREKYLNDAVLELEKSEIRILQKSSIIETEPLGGLDQPKYLNQVIRIETEMSPCELLKECQKIEDKLGRKRDKKWDSRTMDIDILLYDDKRIKDAELLVPHPGIKNRDFVQTGLLELGLDISAGPFT